MNLTEGPHDLTATCPECERTQIFHVTISTRLTVDSEAGGRLAPKLTVKAQDHDCTLDQHPTLL